MSKYQTKTIEDTEMVYSILREKYQDRQIEIEFNDNTKEYTLNVTNEKFHEDPEVPVDLKIKVIYGDSVTGDTPLLLQKDGQVYIETIQSIFDESKKEEYPGFKLFDKTIRLEKEYSLSDYKIWTDQGWVNINRVIRHRTDKKIYRVLTHTGCVDVSEDHSLLDENCERLKPTECNLETKLLSSYPENFNSSVNSISKDRAFIYGFFYGDGSCDKYYCPSGLKNSWALNNQDLTVLNNLRILLDKEYPDHKAVILESSGVYKLSVNNQKYLVEEYRHKFYDSDKYKKVPTEILNSDNDIIQSFFEGYWQSDGCRKDKETIGCTRFDNKGQIGSAGLYYLMKKLGYKVSLNTRTDKEKIFRLTITKNNQRKISNKIKKIQELSSVMINDYIYDIETEIGRFGCGIGNIIASNTDSVFLSMKFNRENFELNRKDAFKMGIICGDNLTEQIFKRPPIELEFEKVYQPFILLTKKRYIGKKFEDTRDPLKLKTVTTAGIALTRRNYSQLVKKCYKEVIDCILDTGDLEKSCDIYKNYIEQIEKYNVNFEDLVVSAQIGKEYACKECKKKVEWVLRCKNFIKGKLCNESNPHKKSHCDKCKQSFECVHTFSLAHINLAQKLLERNEDIQVGDRIQYIFVEGVAKEQKNELAEDYNYALKHSLKFNRVSYLEQVAKPVLGFLKVCLDNTPDLLDGIIDYTNQKMVQFGGKKLRVSDFKINEDD